MYIGKRMRIIRPWACLVMACLAGSEETAPSLDQVSPTDQPSAIQRDFDFEERPSQDFFCPVSLELLLEPQLTSCCGHHLSSEAVNRLLREGKPCPMCGGEQWSAMLDKYHRRKVHEVRVRCSHKENGCGWVGEINGFFRHVDSCDKRPWECEYCGLKCTRGEGGEKHWPTCSKFPEPCPNSCEVGSVERCNMEQHRSECSLEPVACEMKEFGCSVVVPRKELARHMRESELQHLTAMTMLNLRLTRQLQQELTERDRKMAQLQQESIQRIENLQTAMTELKIDMKRVDQTSHHIEQHVGGACSGCEVLTFTQYSSRKWSDQHVYSDPFYSHHYGYKARLRISFYGSHHNDIGAYLSLLKGEYDDKLHWPVKVKVQLELLNQTGDHHHEMRTKNMEWTKGNRDKYFTINDYLIKYPDLEKLSEDVQYMMNDCLKFRVQVTIIE